VARPAPGAAQLGSARCPGKPNCVALRAAPARVVDKPLFDGGIRDHLLGRVGGSRGTQIGDQVAQRLSGLVTTALIQRRTTRPRIARHSVSSENGK